MGGWSREDKKPTLVDAERDTGGSEDADGVVSDKIGDASIDEETSIINEGGDSHWHSLRSGWREREKGVLKANGIEGSEGVSLFAPNGHAGDKCPLAE